MGCGVTCAVESRVFVWGDLVGSDTVAQDSQETNQMPRTILSLASSQIFKLVEKKQFCSHVQAISHHVFNCMAG